MSDTADALLARLDREEKIRLLTGRDAWHVPGVERLGLPPVTLTDGPHGVRLSRTLDLRETEPATVFPVAAVMGATFDPDLIEQVGEAIGREARRLGVAVLLGPGINGKRSPLAGRNFEYYSEDPLVSGRLAAAFVRGVQAQGVGACLKHFVANEQETRRFVIDTRVDVRALQEIYLRPFALAIREARPWMVMAAYNQVNGEPCWASPWLLETVLRRQLGFEGVVVSDWGAVRDKVAAHRAGLDLEMPGPNPEGEAALRAALERGELDEAEIDARVRRVLELLLRARAAAEAASPEVDFEAHHALARTVAERGMVLLEDAQGMLPLAPGRRLLIVGRGAERLRFQGGGSSQMNPSRTPELLAALRERAAIDFEPGHDPDDPERDRELRARAIAKALDADAVVLCLTGGALDDAEGVDRKHLFLPADQRALATALCAAQPRTVAVLFTGSAVDLQGLRPGALLWAGLPGQAGGEALARVLFGEAEPGGRLAESWPRCLAHTPAHGFFPGDREKVEYREGVFVGYRHYDSKALPVAYPFGHGLGYTRFDYRDGSYEAATRRVTLTVQNIGARAGDTVVQVYVHARAPYRPKPEHWLAGFARVHLAPGESRRVTVTLAEDAFAHYDEALGRFAVEAGDHELRIGASSRDIRLRLPVTVESTDPVRPRPGWRDTVEEWLADARTAAAMREALELLGCDARSPAYSCVLGFHVDMLLDRFAPGFGVDAETIAAARARLTATQA
ncbi:MAG: glycosyl hydrolase [Gammaproteobacteria bacterium]|nr:MAG: glycosyl hydrolase [Gammaproteobacteria bacterium]